MSAVARDDGPQARRPATVNELASKARKRKRYEPVGGEGVDVRATLRDLGLAKAENDAQERLMAEVAVDIKKQMAEKGHLPDETFRRWNMVRVRLQEAEARVRMIENLLRARAGQTGGYP